MILSIGSLKPLYIAKPNTPNAIIGTIIPNTESNPFAIILSQSPFHLHQMINIVFF